MCLVLAGLAVCFSSIVNSIRNPLRHLEAACKEVEKGNFSITLDDEGKDELTHFSKSFETMTSEIQLLIQEKYEQKLQYNHLEIQMLRAQINPHFLYNNAGEHICWSLFERRKGACLYGCPFRAQSSLQYLPAG